MKNTILILFLVLPLLYSCDDGDDGDEVQNFDEGPELYAELEKTGEHSILLELLDQTESKKYLFPGTIFFAPTNQAFQNYFSNKGISGLSDLSDFEKKKLEVSLNFIAYGSDFTNLNFEEFEESYFRVLESSGSSFANTDSLNHNYSIYVKKESENNVQINYSINSTDVRVIKYYSIGNEEVGEVNISTNPFGLVFINELYKAKNCYEWISTLENLSEFKALVDHAQLDDFLKNQKFIHVLAPNNQAMNSFYTELGVSSASEIDVEVAKDYVWLHTILNGYSSYNDIENTPEGQSNFTSFADGINNQDLIITINNLASQSWQAYESFNSGRVANLEIRDIAGNNGYVHVVDQVLLLP